MPGPCTAWRSPARIQDRRPGFILLSARDATKRDRGNSDELQDLTCTIADHPTH